MVETAAPHQTDEWAEMSARLEQALFEVKKVIVGQDHMLQGLLVSLLARGHCLLEGVPGLAKTLTVETIARVCGGSFVRLQFTPDMLPADIVGTRIYRASTEAFDVELGPVFANFVLTDEINRAPAKVQSALLEVMAERHVSIGGETFPAPDPFFVLATQNPIESEGVYPLPEAQRDRFFMKLRIDYPSHHEEAEIIRRMSVDPPEAEQVLGPEDILWLQQITERVFVDAALVDYTVRLVMASRRPGDFGLEELEPAIAYGAGPRGSLGLVAAARALAVLRGRPYALPQDVWDVAVDVLNHRILLSYEAMADGIEVEDALRQIMAAVPAPQITPAGKDELGRVDVSR